MSARAADRHQRGRAGIGAVCAAADRARDGRPAALALQPDAARLAGLAAALFWVPLWMLPMHDETQPFAALLIALGVMAVIAPFPFPLIGYCASPILGFGLALGAVADTRCPRLSGKSPIR